MYVCYMQIKFSSGKRKKFVFNAFVDLKPVERCENGSDMWTVEVAMVLDVLKSRYGRIQRSSRLC